VSTLWKVIAAFAIGVTTAACLLGYIGYAPRDFGWPNPQPFEPPTVEKADRQTLAQLDAACDDFLGGECLSICIGGSCPDPRLPKERCDRWQRIANTTRSAAEVLRVSGQACLNRPDISETTMLHYVCNSRRERSAAQTAEPMLFIVDTLKRVYAPTPNGRCPTDDERLRANPAGK
jgi:hypothetical protein